MGWVAAVVAMAAVLAPPTPVTPPPDGLFHIQFSGELRAPSDVAVVEIDAADTSPSVIARLHDEGRYVICYLSAGTREAWRDDAARFPRSTVGSRLPEWDGERWLDIRDPRILPIMADRVRDAAGKGCDGVEFDNVDGYANRTGFPLTAKDQITYNTALARLAHEHGMSAGLKNATGLIPALEPVFDWALNEQCVTYRECDAYTPFVTAGKPVWVLEYGQTGFRRVCETADAAGLSAQVKRSNLGAWSRHCLTDT